MKPVNLVHLVLLLAVTTPAAAETRVSERHAAPPGGVVEISNVVGSVRVEGWARDEVEVTGTLGDGVERLEFATRDGRTTVRVHLARRDRQRGRDTEAHLVVRVPERSRVVASTVAAPLTAVGLDGTVELKSVSAGVDLSGGYTRADVQSVSGTVRIRRSGPDARVSAGSISGIVQVDAMDGELQANSISGAVRVTAGLRRAELKSVSGEVLYDGPLLTDGVYELETTSGVARLIAGEPVDARFELHTFNGTIQNAFGPEPTRTSRHAPGQTLDFSEGGGSAQVTMRAISGTLRLAKK